MRNHYYVRSLAFLVFSIMLLALTGCSENTKKGNTDIDNQIIEDKDQNGVVDKEYVSLKTVFYNFGKNPISYGAHTSYGYYYFVSRQGIPYDENEGELGNANLTYLDYSSASQIILCSIPGCLHNTPDCTSYVSGWGGGILFPDYYEDHIMFLSKGSKEKDATEAQLGKIEIMNRDGTDRKLLYRLTAKEYFSTEDCIFVDETGVYAFVVTLDENSNGYIKELRRIDLNTGEIRVLLSTKMDSILCSCYEDKILFLKYKESPKAYYTLNVVSGEIENVYKGKGAVLSHSHYLIWANENAEGTANLDILDILDGSTRTIEGIPCCPGNSIQVDNYYDDTVEWTFITPSPEEKLFSYLVNIKNGEYYEKKLFRRKYANDNIFNPIGIVGETGDGRFLVSSDANTCEVTFFDYLGIPHVVVINDRPSYALITKEDYYAGIPNYQFIEDSVYKVV